MVTRPQVKCLHAGVGGLDISHHSYGILCGDLLTRLPTVLDYARKRIGFRVAPNSVQQQQYDA
jgi:hypothetical protein